MISATNYKLYLCTELGCKMGEVSQYVVPAGSYVRIPFSTGEKRCLKICQCSTDGIIEKCQSMPCFPLDPCWVAGKKIGRKYISMKICM